MLDEPKFIVNVPSDPGKYAWVLYDGDHLIYACPADWVGTDEEVAAMEAAVERWLQARMDAQSVPPGEVSDV